MTEDQLLKLVRLATGTSDTAWLSHAVSCLLQDLLEGEKTVEKLLLKENKMFLLILE